MKQGAEQADDRRGIQSIEIGLRLIEALRSAGVPLALGDLARASGVPGSKCHRYCVSFVRCGFLSQNLRTGRYSLGPSLLRAGLAALSQLDAVTVATEALDALVDETGHTGMLAIWADLGPTIVRWMAGRMAVRTSLAAGSRLPLLTSATGRVFLAFLPERQTEKLAARERPRGGDDPRVLADQVRAAGVGEVSGDHIPGLSAIAAPVLDLSGEAAAVITLVATRDGIETPALECLRREAARASLRLGHASPGYLTESFVLERA